MWSDVYEEMLVMLLKRDREITILHHQYQECFCLSFSSSFYYLRLGYTHNFINFWLLLIYPSIPNLLFMMMMIIAPFYLFMLTHNLFVYLLRDWVTITSVTSYIKFCEVSNTYIRQMSYIVTWNHRICY